MMKIRQCFEAFRNDVNDEDSITLLRLDQLTKSLFFMSLFLFVFVMFH